MTTFNGQDWKEDWFLPELKLQLQHPAPADARRLWEFDLSFVPLSHDLDPADFREQPGPHLMVSVMGSMPAGSGWQDLEGMSFEPTEEEPCIPEAHIWTWHPDGRSEAGQSSTTCQVRFLRREGWKFQMELSVWLSRAGSINAQLEELAERMAGGGGERCEREEEAWNERRDFYWVGEVQFTEVRFAAPINAPHPKKLAEDVTRRQLKLDIPAFRNIYINGDHVKPVTPQTGICATGCRLVMLILPN